MEQNQWCTGSATAVLVMDLAIRCIDISLFDHNVVPPEKLLPHISAQLAEIANNPKLVRSFFKHPNVAYISDL
jgi:hypothetical protein